MTIETDFNHMRMKLAIRKAMLSARGHEYPRRSLLQRFRWASQELFDAVVAECIAEGVMSEKTSRHFKVSILVWHEQ